MKRNYATFEADVPEDAEWDESENLIVPGGRNLMTAFAEQLQRKGWRCSAPEQHSFYGWTFEVATPSGTVEVLIQFPEPWLLLLVRPQTFFQKLLGRLDHRVEESLLEAVHEILATDPRISNLRWWSHEDYAEGRQEAAAARP